MTVLGRFAAVAAMAVVVWLTLDLLLLVAAGVLLAIFLRTLARFTAAHTRLSIGASLAVVVAVLAAAGVLAGWLSAPTLAEQADQMTRTLPQAISDLSAWARQYGWGRWFTDQLSAAQSSDEIVNRATRAVSTIVNGAVGAAIVLFIGLYLAADPTTYLRGMLRLWPQARRRRVAEVMFAVGHTLRWWLLGQAIAMTIVGLAMGIGLAIIGVPLAFALGVLAGLLEFVPLVGPLLGLGPALVLGAAEGTRLALYVLVLYGAVQTAESYIVTPLVQRRVVHLPPALTITAQVAWGWMAGPLGLLLAVPITAAALVTVQMLYVKDVLHGRLEIDAEDEGRRELHDAESLQALVRSEPRDGQPRSERRAG